MKDTTANKIFENAGVRKQDGFAFFDGPRDIKINIVMENNKIYFKPEADDEIIFMHCCGGLCAVYLEDFKKYISIFKMHGLNPVRNDVILTEYK